jgi:hypothetical protein
MNKILINIPRFLIAWWDFSLPIFSISEPKITTRRFIIIFFKFREGSSPPKILETASVQLWKLCLYGGETHLPSSKTASLRICKQQTCL